MPAVWVLDWGTLERWRAIGCSSSWCPTLLNPTNLSDRIATKMHDITLQHSSVEAGAIPDTPYFDH